MNGLADDCYKFGAGRFVMRRGLLEETGGVYRSPIPDGVKPGEGM